MSAANARPDDDAADHAVFRTERQPCMAHHIAMWSGPRNLSTAMLRSSGARADTMVTDESFYGAYLHHTGDDQPIKDAVIASMD